MTKVILITAAFPYLPGEQFLETEVKYYSQHKDIEFTIMPSSSNKQVREVDTSIKIDSFLIENSSDSKLKKLYKFFKSMFLKIFYKELFSIPNKFNFSTLKEFASAMASYQAYYDSFKKYFKNKKDLENTIIYTYWNDTFTYALQSLKNKHGYKLVSRTHGYDIYKERRVNNYMPLKSNFILNIDRIYTITESANEYLQKVYGFNKKRLELSRLGVIDYNIISSPSDTNVFHIVSCSFLVTVKRIDKIIATLALLGKSSSTVQFKWTHLGDGPLRNNLEEEASNKLNEYNNVQFNFMGNLKNQEVYDFYKSNKVDVFINVSESEGVPVSVMEAMSCHIPIIAPDVGGISDMVDNQVNGVLLNSSCEINDIAKCLEDICFFKRNDVRRNSYKTFIDKYNAEKNYSKFIDNLKRLQ
jgi:glycosyltransferase involved in cell wall biosynthesis